MLVSAWREAGDIFTDKEKAALQWAEAVTLISETHAPDEAFAAVSAQFQPKEISDLTLAIGVINTYNRLSIGLRGKPTIAATVAAGCSSISQWPELATTWPATLLATKRRTSAIAVPNDCRRRSPAPAW